MTATISALPMMDVMQKGLSDFNRSILDKIPFHDWPYWKDLLIGIGLALIALIFIWFYQNFIR